MRFFFFGSLMDREVLALVIGHPTDDLRAEPATIHSFARRRARDEAFPVLVPCSGGRVEGVLVIGLSAADIARIQFYEGQDYALAALPVECRGEQVAAQVFLPTARLEAEETPWDLDSWMTGPNRALFMALCADVTLRQDQYRQERRTLAANDGAGTRARFHRCPAVGSQPGNQNGPLSRP